MSCNCNCNCTHDSDVLYTTPLSEIKSTDTISQFMEKCNNNFATLIEWGGGPTGAKGDEGDPGVPTKPKVPIHAWRKGEEFTNEVNMPDGKFAIPLENCKEELSDVKYQEGHLIMLENGHVYILKLDNENDYQLKPEFIIALQTYNPDDVIHGKTAYLHVAYANSNDGSEDFVTAQKLGEWVYEDELPTTFGLNRSANKSDNEYAYMGTCGNHDTKSPENPKLYTWVKVQGGTGPIGEKGDKGDKGDEGPKGDKGDAFTGHQYTIDLEGDMSTISLDVDRTRLYDDSNDYCECIVHAYYGDKNITLNSSKVSINLPKEFTRDANGYILTVNGNIAVGKIEKTQSDNNVVLKFIPDDSYVFPKETITFSVHVEDEVYDEDDKNSYKFTRDAVWMIKGIVSDFELEIVPQYRVIKLFEDGEYYPEKLLASVHEIRNAERTTFDLTNTDFTLLYKTYNSNEWLPYTDGVSVEGASCIEFKLVKNYKTDNEEVWDYEDVWVVADGKSTHYYHADLGNVESMMVLTTGEQINIGTPESPKLCAELKNKNGYSITFNPKFFDGSNELQVESVNVGSNSGEEYYLNGTFVYEIQNSTEEVEGVEQYKSTLTVTQVPFGVEMIPMTINVVGKNPVYNNLGEFTKYEFKNDTISFNIYISTSSDIYTLVPTPSSYNTSMGKTGDTISCNVYKNNTLIPTAELNQNALTLEYIVHDGSQESNIVIYDEPLIFGNDDDNKKDDFAAKDVAIEFILSYRSKEIVRSTVPLLKDGIDGRDGDTWQYIFCTSPYYPFDKTGISDPNKWTNDPNPDKSDCEYLGDNETGYDKDSDKIWYDNHQGVDSEYKYEYQSYRQWDKTQNKWGAYYPPTLYSNYSENGTSYSVILSNPISIIPVGVNTDDWSVEENNKNQFDYTLVHLYDNTSDISTNKNISISIPEDNKHFDVVKDNKGVNKVRFTPVVDGDAFDFGSNTQFKLPITVTYTLGKDADNDGKVDKFETTTVWTLSPIKGLNDVEVFVDKRVVNTSVSESHILKVGYYLISSDGTRKLIESYDADENKSGYKIKLTDDIGNLPSNVVSDWSGESYDFVIDSKNRNCYVVLVDEDETTIVDYINVTAINDGKSAMHLELSQDYIAIPCDNNGKIHPNYNEPIESQMLLYNGHELIQDGITYSFKINGENIEGFSVSTDGIFTVPSEIIDGDTNIECIATYNNVSFHKTLFIDLEDTPYELELNKKTLSRDVNTNKIIDESIMVRVKYWMNGYWVYTNEGVVKATTTNGGENLVFDVKNESEYIRVLKITDSALETNNVDSEVRISYFKTDTEELTYETVGIINNGRNAVAPTCVSVEILGYSLNENEDPETGTWYKTINELGALNAGIPIYILNKTTWSDGNTSKNVTVTLSGSQGIDGKSRVLFYLGSFQDGTLSGDHIVGNLDDEQCDYFIDDKGNAWMRTGTEGEAYGYPSGNENDPNWKPSTKVGFLQAGAISAEMINTESLISDTTFTSKLFALEIEATNLKISAGNIDGTLSEDNFSEGLITENMISQGAITETKITPGAITTGHIAANAITTDVINAGAITTEKIDVGAITAEKIDAGAITAEKIDVGAITAEKIAANAITAEKIAANAITAEKINTKDLSVQKLNTTGGDIGAGTIKIEDNELQVFNLTESKEVLRITGKELSSIPTDKTTTVGATGATIFNSTNTTFGTSLYALFNTMLGANEYVSVTKDNQTSIVIPDDGETYILSDLPSDLPKDYLYINFTRKIQTEGDPSIDIPSIEERALENLTPTPDDIRLGLKFIRCIVKDDSGIDENILKTSLKASKDTLSTTDKTNNIFAFDAFNELMDVDRYNQTFAGESKIKIYTSYKKMLDVDTGGSNYILFTSNILTPGTYHIYTFVQLMPLNNVESTLPIYCRSIGNYLYTFKYKNIISPKAEVSSYGFRYIVDDKKYASLTKDGTFLFRNGDSILAVSDSGIGISLTGNMDDIKKIEPVRKKFRLAGSKNINLTVLTLNGSLEVEEN